MIGAFGAPIGPEGIPTVCGGYVTDDVTAECFQIKELVIIQLLSAHSTTVRLAMNLISLIES